MAQCPHGSSMPDELIGSLGDSQGGSGRHKCAVCAYARGADYTGGGGPVEQCSHGNIAPVATLQELPDYQGGPARHKCTVCAFVEGVAQGAASLEWWDSTEVAAESEQEVPGEVEGTPVWRTHRTYERNTRNRARAILQHGNVCHGCGFSFDSFYTSEHARGYIEVHHLRPLSEGPRTVNPYEDLIPLCANCHRMVHKSAERWLSLNELRQIIESAREESEDASA